MSDTHENPDLPPEDGHTTEDAAARAGAPREEGIEVPDDASALDAPAPGAAPAEASAAERAASASTGPSASTGRGGDPQRELEQQLGERTADLQRLQAEYVNYKRRVDRDRDLARQRGVEQVVGDLLPVLDSIAAARQHDELEGGFRMVADELEKVTKKYGLVTFGEVGEPFDPTLHDALMHMPYEGEHDVTVVSVVIQKGARLNDRVIRPARVGVADPDE